LKKFQFIIVEKKERVCYELKSVSDVRRVAENAERRSTSLTVE
jgi:hypothetical protein